MLEIQTQKQLFPSVIRKYRILWGKKIVFIFKFINTQFLLIKSENKQHSHNYSQNILAIMGPLNIVLDSEWPSGQP